MGTILFVAGIFKIAIIFIAALSLLVLVHEAGHFFAAKLTGMRVDEFGIGFPPRLWGKKWRGTEYTINALPLGGFVRIYGEDGVAEKDDKENTNSAFIAKSSLARAFVLVAGVSMNIILAWIFIFGMLTLGTPTRLVVDQVIPNTPAAAAGIKSSDIIVSARTNESFWKGDNATSFAAFVSSDTGQPLRVSVLRDGKKQTLTVRPAQHVIPQKPERYAIGITQITEGTPATPFPYAFVPSIHKTWSALTLSTGALLHFFGRMATLSANLSNVAGPIGIATIVGNAPNSGPGYFMFILAIISLNLAIINLLPIPALDGGRLFFLLIETISRRKIPPRIANAVNMFGFALIILLMVVVSIHDIYRLVG